MELLKVSLMNKIPKRRRTLHFLQALLSSYKRKCLSVLSLTIQHEILRRLSSNQPNLSLMNFLWCIMSGPVIKFDLLLMYSVRIAVLIRHQSSFPFEGTHSKFLRHIIVLHSSFRLLHSPYVFIRL